jgi:hypothetical protein
LASSRTLLMQGRGQGALVQGWEEQRVWEEGRGVPGKRGRRSGQGLWVAR